MSKDPYVYDNTNVLKNLANIKEQHKLDDYETTMVNLGIIKLLKSDIEIVKVNDIFLIHKILFENVYEWAGEKRVINIFKTEPILNGLSVTYSDYNKINDDLTKIQKDINSTEWKVLSKNEMINLDTIKSIEIFSFLRGLSPTVTTFIVSDNSLICKSTHSSCILNTGGFLCTQMNLKRKLLKNLLNIRTMEQ